MVMGLRLEPCKDPRGDHASMQFLKNKLCRATAWCAEAEVKHNIVALDASFTPVCTVLSSSCRHTSVSLSISFLLFRTSICSDILIFI